MPDDRTKVAPDTVAYPAENHKPVGEFAVPEAPTDAVDVKILADSIQDQEQERAGPSPVLNGGSAMLMTTLFAHRDAPRKLVARSTATTQPDSDEVLVVDPRGRLTPAQMVDQKLLALLGYCPRSLQPVT